MPFIRTQKLVYDKAGRIVSGSASIIDVTYNPEGEKYKSKQTVRERLGRVVEMYGKRKGLFQSPTRGLVVYDADADAFSSSQMTRDEYRSSQIEKNISEEVNQKQGVGNEHESTSNELYEEVGGVFPEPDVHTVFGDTYLLIEVMKKSGIWKIISGLFQDKADRQRILCHILYGLLRDGSRISCEDFISKSFASYLTRDIPPRSLKSDTRFFTLMGEDKLKLAFFTAYAASMREKEKSFGRACYVDSTPLPNSIDSPFNALCSHGLDATSVQMRLALVLDETSLYPVWYEIIPGNLLDLSTLTTVTKDVEISLDLHLSNYTLDAGYASKELIRNFESQQEYGPAPDRTYLVRMPAKKGFPYKQLYSEMKEYQWKPKYEFVRKGHMYFGKEVVKTIFDRDVQCYVFVDKYNALKGYTQFMTTHSDEYEKLTLREQAWYQVKCGFFVLMCNYRKTPQQILDDYFGRSRIESFFKNSKEYLKLLPLCKWSDTTVRGKILSDVITAIVKLNMLQMRKSSELSMSSVIGKCQSLFCIKDSKTNKVFIEKPNKQVRECYENFGITVPGELDLTTYIDELLGSNE